MTEKTREIVLTRESLREIAQEAANMVVSQLFLDDRIEISPDQTDKIADKVASRLDATVDYDKIRDARDDNKEIFSEIGQLRTDVFSKVSALEDDFFQTETGPERDTYKLTVEDRADIAEQALSGLDLSEEFRNMLVRSFVSRTFLNEKIGALTKFVRENRSKAVTAGISGGDMVEEINKILGTDWQTGDGAGGDMLKSVYDTNDDGKVGIADAADSVPWSGITGKPAIGDMSGPAGATDGEIFVSDGTTGKLANRVPVKIDSSGNVFDMGKTEHLDQIYLKIGNRLAWTFNGKVGVPLATILLTSNIMRFAVGSGGSSVILNLTQAQTLVQNKLTVFGDTGQKVHLNSFSNPPTLSELNGVFGTPAAVGDKFTASINNGDAGTNFYRVYSDGANWHILTAIKAV